MFLISYSIKWVVDMWTKEGLVSFLVAVVIAIAVVVAITSFCAWLLMLAWNWSGVGVFHQHPFTFWQSLGLLMLCTFLFWFVESMATAIKK